MEHSNSWSKAIRLLTATSLLASVLIVPNAHASSVNDFLQKHFTSPSPALLKSTLGKIEEELYTSASCEDILELQEKTLDLTEKTEDNLRNLVRNNDSDTITLKRILNRREETLLLLENFQNQLNSFKEGCSFETEDTNLLSTQSIGTISINNTDLEENSSCSDLKMVEQAAFTAHLNASKTKDFIAARYLRPSEKAPKVKVYRINSVGDFSTEDQSLTGTELNQIALGNFELLLGLTGTLTETVDDQLNRDDADGNTFLENRVDQLNKNILSLHERVISLREDRCGDYNGTSLRIADLAGTRISLNKMSNLNCLEFQALLEHTRYAHTTLEKQVNELNGVAVRPFISNPSPLDITGSITVSGFVITGADLNSLADGIPSGKPLATVEKMENALKELIQQIESNRRETCKKSTENKTQLLRRPIPVRSEKERVIENRFDFKKDAPLNIQRFKSGRPAYVNHVEEEVTTDGEVFGIIAPNSRELRLQTPDESVLDDLLQAEPVLEIITPVNQGVNVKDFLRDL